MCFYIYLCMHAYLDIHVYVRSYLQTSMCVSMSICVYISYVWFSNFWSMSNVRYSITALHESPLFWLTLILVAGMTFLGDVVLAYVSVTFFKDGSDYVREFMKRKRGDGWNDLTVDVTVTQQDLDEINAFMEGIKKYHREND